MGENRETGGGARRAPNGLGGGDFGLVGQSRPMRALYEGIMAAAPLRAPVLIVGENGSGRETAARAVHALGARPEGPFTVYHCAARGEGGPGEDLFGRETRGGWAGRPGALDRARGGTLYLDEIGDLDAATQARLLEFLRRSEYRREGGDRVLRAAARVMAASDRDLAAEAAAGRFSVELLACLRGLTLRVPPLRERKEDIPALVDHWVGRFAAEYGKGDLKVSPAALDLMLGYAWPGNVREMASSLEHAVLLCDDGVLRATHLSPVLRGGESGPPPGAMQEAIAKMEREYIVEALRAHRGNLAAAARSLGLTERVLRLRAKRHGLRPGDYRMPARV